MTVKKILSIVIVCGLVLTGFSTVALAGSANGYVKYVTVHQPPGVAMVAIEGSRSEKPWCSRADDGKGFALRLDSAGKAALAVILSAANLNAEVVVYGTGICDVWGDRETFSWIQMAP